MNTPSNMPLELKGSKILSISAMQEGLILQLELPRPEDPMMLAEVIHVAVLPGFTVDLPPGMALTPENLLSVPANARPILSIRTHQGPLPQAVSDACRPIGDFSMILGQPIVDVIAAPDGSQGFVLDFACNHMLQLDLKGITLLQVPEAPSDAAIVQ